MCFIDGRPPYGFHAFLRQIARVPLAWLLLVCPLALAQTTADSSTEAKQLVSKATNSTTTKEDPPELSLSDILSESNLVRERLRKLAPKKDPQFIKDLSEALPDLRFIIDVVESRLRSVRGRSAGSYRITSLSDTLLTADLRLESLRKDLITYTEHLQSALTQLGREQARWEKAGELARNSKAPGSLLEQIDSTVTSLGTANKEISLRLDEALTLQGALSSEARRLAAADEEVALLKEEVRASLLHRDSPPLWRLFETSLKEDLQEDDIGFVVTENLKINQAYLGRHNAELLLLCLAFPLIIGGIIALRSQHAVLLRENLLLEDVNRLFRRPASTALLVTLLLSPWVFAGSPDTIRRASLLLAMIPMFRLVPVFVPSWLRITSLGVLVAAIVARIAFLLPEGAWLSRTLHAVLAISMAALAWHALRRMRSAERVQIFARVIARCIVVLMGISLFANVLGVTILASTLAQAVILCCLSAIVLSATHKVLMGTLRLMSIIGPLRELSSVRAHYPLIDLQVSRVLSALLALVWVMAVLKAFMVFDVFMEGITSLLTREWHFGALSLSLGSILVFILAVWVSLQLSRIIRFFLESDLLPLFSMPKGLPGTISMMVHYGLLTLGFLVACAAAGVELSNLSIIIGALGVGIGFGLQNLVNNFVSGLILVFERPVKIGDTVQFGTTSGVIQRIGIRSSAVRTFEGAEIIVPNGNLISEELINWTLSDRSRRIDLKVGVAYGCDPNRVIEFLVQTAVETPGVEKVPAPWASFDGFGESSLDFTLRCWTGEYDNWVRVKSALGVAVYARLTKEGIEIPFPQREVRLLGTAPATQPPVRPESLT